MCLNKIQDLQQKISDLRINLSMKDKKIQALEKGRTRNNKRIASLIILIENQELRSSLDLYRSLAVNRHLK